jgi:hypothetical protein
MQVKFQYTYKRYKTTWFECESGEMERHTDMHKYTAFLHPN